MQKMGDLLKRLKKSNVLVLGDLILDHFIWGKVDRISPEAPVPVVRVTRENFMPGGSANVALNVRSLGGKVAVCGIVGEDIYGKNLVSILNEKGVDTDSIIVDKKRPTTLKTRVIAQHQHVVRVDKEEIVETDKKLAERIRKAIKSKFSQYNVIIFSDYAKGLINRYVKDVIIEEIGGKKVFLLADPKVKNIDLFKDFFLVTPNKKEAFESVGSGIIDDEKVLISVGEKLIKRLNLKNLLITRGEEGMSLFMGKKHIRIPTFAQEVYDVSGAGDTVIATIACGLSSGLDIIKSSIISNIAASVVVGKMGTATTTVEEIENRWKGLDKKVKTELEHLL